MIGMTQQVGRGRPRANDVAVAADGVPPEADEAWLRAVHEAHAGPVYTFVLRLCLGDRQAAEDVLQEVLTRAWRHGRRLSGGVEDLRPWLFTVARRIAIDAARARSARPQEVGLDALFTVPATADPCEAVFTTETIRRALALLSPKYREVIVDLYFRELKVSQVAQRRGIPEGTVKSRAFYGLRMLRSLLDETGGRAGVATA